MPVCKACQFYEPADDAKSCPLCGAPFDNAADAGTVVFAGVHSPEGVAAASASAVDSAPMVDKAQDDEPHEEEHDTKLILTEGKTGEAIVIDSPSCVLGREGDYRPELFSNKVSRSHLEIDYFDGVWRACHISQTNATVLISREGRFEMEYGLQYPLHGGERLRIADQVFSVRVEKIQQVKHVQEEHVDVQEAPIEPESSSARSVGWLITCRKCGTVHLVSSEDTRLDECHHCLDSLDKRDIRKMPPVFGEYDDQAVIDVR